MRKIVKLMAAIILLSGIFSSTSGQVTEAEKNLRTQSKDTLLGWKTGGVLNINLAQTSLTNWAAGGQNSLSVNGLFSGFASYKMGKSVWDNSLDLGYGLLKQGSEDLRKTDDKIDFLSKYGREAFKSFYYAALLNFKTQFSPGYNYPDVTKKISDFMSPGYLLLALGLDYKPNTYFSAFLAPLTAKFTFVNDKALSDLGAFGVDPGSKSRGEIGGYFRAIYSRNDFKGEFLKNISFTTKIDLFSNYTDKPQNVDVNWEILLAMKVNKYLSVNFNTQLIYDDNIQIPVDKNNNGTLEPGESIRSMVQFKEILGVGLSYKF
jgi:hypothetical protein